MNADKGLNVMDQLERCNEFGGGEYQMAVRVLGAGFVGVRRRSSAVIMGAS